MTDLLDQQWTPSPEASESRVGEETIMLHKESGLYFGLDRVGSEVWQGLQSGQSPREICSRLVDEAGAEPERVEADVRTFLEQLAAHDLVRRR